MTSLRSILAVLMAVAALRSAAPGCNPHPLDPSIEPSEPDCPSAPSNSHPAASTVGRTVGDVNRGMEDERRRLWKAYPPSGASAADFNTAEEALINDLRAKDEFFLGLSIPQGVTGLGPDYLQLLEDAIPTIPGVIAPQQGNLKSTFMDGGISRYAYPLFVEWVNALRRSEGRDRDGLFATPGLLLTAAQDESNFRRAYEHARNWSEFISSGLDVSKYLKPDVYIRRQMESSVSLVLARSKPAKLPNPTQAAQALYDLFVEMFGRKEVLAAAETVLRTPKNSVGGLATRANVAVGTFTSAPSPNPFMLFLTLATNSPRGYAITLCFDQSALLAGGATAAFYTQERWSKAFSVFTQLGAKYGEPAVLAAAARLKDATKDGQGGIRGDRQARGLVYWFQALLTDPKAVVPDGRLPQFKASSYDPRWLGRTVEVRGTVSRVDLAKGSFPPYATIHFKESRDDAIMAFSPNSDMLQASYGQDFAGLIGKPTEIWGEVSQWKEGAGVRVLALAQLKVLDAATPLYAGFEESRPDWMTAASPAGNLVDSAKYLAWKNFPPGAKATYETRLLHEYQPGTDRYTRSTISHLTFQLEAIDDKRAIVTSQSAVQHMNGPETRSSNRFIYQAKELPPGSQTDPSFQTTRGEETLVINGKRIATRWESIGPVNDPMSYTKTWYSDEVPGGLVLMRKQEHTDIVGKPYRNITETVFAPVEGVVPEFSLANSENKPAPTAAAPPATPAVTSQVDVATQYNAVAIRAARAKAALIQMQRNRARSGIRLPDEVAAARDRLDAQLQSVVTAMRARDNGQAGQALHAVEGTLTVIEQFLAK